MKRATFFLQASLAGAILLTSAMAEAQARPQDGATGAARQGPSDSLFVELLRRAAVTGGISGPVVRSGPGASSGSPLAYGARGGDLFYGLGYQHRVRYSPKKDAAGVVGFGLGNPDKYLGLEVALTSASTVRNPPFAHGSISIKLHRTLPGLAAIAVGKENIVDWGKMDGGNSWFAVGSKVIATRSNPTKMFGTTILNLGVGNQRFLMEGDALSGSRSVNAFGGISSFINDRSSLIADWTGQDLSLAASVAPFRSWPITVTAGMVDVVGTAGDGARFVAGVGGGIRINDLANLLGGKK